MPLDDTFHVYDTTLRDGAQREGISYSVEDKLNLARLLDDWGVGFIEGGWPGAMPKDTEFFLRAKTDLKLRNSLLAAFGATRKPMTKAELDPQVLALLKADTAVVTLVAKSDPRHVELALRTTLNENLRMVEDTISFLTKEGRRVFLDLEHFFDGYKHDPDYGVQLLERAFLAGAQVGVLCDTNGGTLPDEIKEIVSDVLMRTGVRLGIHAHNDNGCAVANSLAAVTSGATHVQGTLNGYGERCGNADLLVVVPNLVLKMDLDVLPQGSLKETVRVSRAASEIANLRPDTHQPYVGVSAFAHKAGLHASALRVSPELYTHSEPSLVGNDMRVLVTEMAGRASVELKGRELGLDLSKDPELLSKVTDRVKDLEAQGFTFEAADASFELLVKESEKGGLKRHFEVESWRTITEQLKDGSMLAEATVKVYSDSKRIVSTGEGNGPVNALDNALRAALVMLYPELSGLELTDYKVRILDGSHGTGAVTRVLLTTHDDGADWTTVGVGESVIAASFQALRDSLEYGIIRRDEQDHG